MNNQIYVASSVPFELDIGVSFDNEEFLVMDIFDPYGKIIDQAVMIGYSIVHI